MSVLFIILGYGIRSFSGALSPVTHDDPSKSAVLATWSIRSKIKRQ